MFFKKTLDLFLWGFYFIYLLLLMFLRRGISALLSLNFFLHQLFLKLLWDFVESLKSVLHKLFGLLALATFSKVKTKEVGDLHFNPCSIPVMRAYVVVDRMMFTSKWSPQTNSFTSVNLLLTRVNSYRDLNHLEPNCMSLCRRELTFGNLA